ncbi:unnamed protein product [Echinostoma caproni]|uniref:BMERB domain-containing protein n=1 Tax=Echinostoma caproni TaxID=27848 RepID=A0A183ASH1_9TREM|nr:unnamed protein product [Echinostoma caproni]
MHTATYRYALTDFQSPARATQSSNPGTGCSNYISNEQAELEQAQRELDYEAAHLEQRLRLQMARGSGTAAEDELLKRWFILVSRKNTLIRRGIQLSIMEKEDDLKKKTQMLQDELRKLLSIEADQLQFALLCCSSSNVFVPRFLYANRSDSGLTTS